MLRSIEKQLFQKGMQAISGTDTNIPMKGLIYDIKRFAVHDGPGIRATVFFKGCPLNCWWCHNPESFRQEVEEVVSSQRLGVETFETREKVGTWMSVEEVMRELEKERMFMEESGGGVTFSGGEPLMQADFLEALSRECRKKGFHTALDTSGYAPRKVFQRLIPFTDLFLYDIKILDEEEHLRYTGVSNRRILDNLRFLGTQSLRLRLRIPLVPGINDGEKNIRALSSLITEMKGDIDGVDILPYHRLAGHKYALFKLENRAAAIPLPQEELIEKIRGQLASAGTSVSVGG